jgi:large subunit ribosomal protein L9
MSRTPMKLILTQEVSGLGAPGDVVDVKAGYGRNYLIPRGFAIQWTRGAQKQVEMLRRGRAAREIRGLEDAQIIAQQLDGLHVRMRRRAGASGRLFGSVGPVDIADAVREAGGPELDRRRIEVRDPIKTIGSHQVRVRLHSEVSAPVDIEIVAS